ncbi:MAG: glycine-rich domain-containing protein, partial [Patescibacteria group bacterium]
MRFSTGTNFALGTATTNTPNSVSVLNGKAYVAMNGATATGLYSLDFARDAAFRQNATDWRLSDSNLAQRNGTNTYNVLNTSNILVNVTAHDVSAAVICTGNSAQPSSDTLSGRCLTPQQFVGVATGAGLTLINETNGTAVNASDTSAFTNVALVWNSGSATYNSSMYGAKASSTINVYTNLSSLAASFATTATYSTTVNPAPAATAVAINSLQVTPGTSTVDMKSNTIYVGTAAGAGVIQENFPFATGGTITTSGAYTIHTFTGSGTFTPLVAGNVESLVVAGGGGGGWTHAGGGGAGGLVYNSSFAVTAQAYTVTVGAGGNGGASSQLAGS